MAPPLRKIQLPGLLGTAVKRLGRMSAEVARALPDSKGGEEPKDLQRWRTQMFEMFTTTLGQSQQFYAADQWVRLQVMLETAGPVAIGTAAEITPVLSGKGRLLTTDVPYEVYLPKGSRAYYAAENVNRVAVTIEPIPWMEQLALEIRRVGGQLITTAGSIVNAITGKPQPVSPVPPGATKLQRLTPMPPPRKNR